MSGWQKHSAKQLAAPLPGEKVTKWNVTIQPHCRPAGGGSYFSLGGAYRAHADTTLPIPCRGLLTTSADISSVINSNISPKWKRQGSPLAGWFWLKCERRAPSPLSLSLRKWSHVSDDGVSDSMILRFHRSTQAPWRQQAPFMDGRTGCGKLHSLSEYNLALVIKKKTSVWLLMHEADASP